MPNQEILDYLLKAKASGRTDKEIHRDLTANGWSDMDADEVFQEFWAEHARDFGQTLKTARRFVSWIKLALFTLLLILLALAFILLIF
jgi:hypothetical protein